MAKQLQCNSCGAKYPDTRLGVTPTYTHVCPAQIVDQPEQVDANHNILKPATFKPVPNPRNENFIPDPNNPGAFVIISAGSGITEIN